MNALIGMFRQPAGRHHAAKHAAPKQARHFHRANERREADAYDEMTMALFEQWNLPVHVLRRIVSSTLAATRSIDAALTMTDLIRTLAVTGGAR